MIIVTGGAGFIGSNIVKRLNDEGYENILIVDNLKNSGKHLNLNRLKFSDYIQKEDFYDNLSLDRFGKVEAVFHQGACSDTTEMDGVYMMKNNYESSKTLLAECVRKKVKFLYASSASVYGNGDDGFSETTGSEYPLNVYAYSKHIFDNYVRQLNGKHENQITGLRYFNVYGPQENHKGKMASVFFHFYNQARENGIIKVFEGSRDFLRDFVYVCDVADVNMHFFNNNISGIFNCGTGNAVSFFEVAEAIKNHFGGEKVRIEEISFPGNLKGKYQAYTKADLACLRKTGKYEKEFTGIKQGIAGYYSVLDKSSGYYR